MNVLDLFNAVDESVFDGVASAQVPVSARLNVADAKAVVLPVDAEEG